MSAPAATKSRTPSAVTTFPATTGTPVFTDLIALSASIIFRWCPCAVSTTRTSTPASIKYLAFAATSPLIPTAAAMRKLFWASSAGE